jgi:hypothetical protein
MKKEQEKRRRGTFSILYNQSPIAKKFPILSSALRITIQTISGWDGAPDHAGSEWHSLYNPFLASQLHHSERLHAYTSKWMDIVKFFMQSTCKGVAGNRGEI